VAETTIPASVSVIKEASLPEQNEGMAGRLAEAAREMIRNVRRNHALEHATVHLLGRRLPTLHLVGRTTPGGFYLYGDVDLEALRETAEEALMQLPREPGLAVHPRCGTNLAVTAIVAGCAAFGAAGPVRGRPRIASLPQVLMASLWGVLLAQPLGLLVQKYLTTSANVEGGHIGTIRSTRAGQLNMHFVPLTWE
jgi:hypothetical protein